MLSSLVINTTLPTWSAASILHYMSTYIRCVGSCCLARGLINAGGYSSSVGTPNIVYLPGVPGIMSNGIYCGKGRETS